MTTLINIITTEDIERLAAQGIWREIRNGQWVDAQDVKSDAPHDTIKNKILSHLNRLLPVPEIAIDVIAPSDTVQAVENRLADYLRTGVKEVWQVYPISQQVIVYKVGAHPAIYTSEQTLTTDLLPHFEMLVKEIFEAE